MHIRHRIQSTVTELIAALVIAALIVVVPAPLLAQQKAAPAKPVAVAEEDESATPAKPGSEGIKVHGHWIIDVKDKDGKIVEHRDFHNALVSDGAAVLISLATGRVSAEQMEVGLANGNNSTSFGLYVANSAFSVGATCTNYYTTCYSSLTRSLGSNNLNQVSSIILSGTVPGQSSAYTVTSVATMLNSCGVSSGNGPTTVSPSACTSTINSSAPGNQFYVSQFTATTISSLAVAAGQSLSVTVTLSFS